MGSGLQPALRRFETYASKAPRRRCGLCGIEEDDATMAVVVEGILARVAVGLEGAWGVTLDVIWKPIDAKRIVRF